MPELQERPTARPSLWLAGLTVGWIIGLIALLWLLWAGAWDGWAAHYGGGSGLTAVQRGRRTGSLLLGLAGVGVGGPVVLAFVAGLLDKRRAVGVFAALAVVLAVPAAPVAYAGMRAHQSAGETEQNGRGPVAPGPRGCQEHSGGDNRCPGG